MQTGSEKLSWVIEKLGAAVSQLSVLRGAGGDVIPALLGLVAAADAGDGRTAALRSGELTSALLSCGARRVSGDLMTDFVLDTILMSRNPFAEAASAGRMDEAVFRAMRRDLAATQVLSELDEDVINRIIAECGEGKRVDPAVKFATAAWGGAPAPNSQSRDQLPKFRFEPSEKCWNYGEFELRDAYCADAALESMYRRFLESDDWTQLASDLWSFHSAYGCGDFLRYRNFCLCENGTLRPLPDLRPGDFVPLMEAEYRTLLNNAIAFLRDESAKPMLLFGAVMAITNAFSVSDVPRALAGYPSTDYAARTIVTHLFDYGFTRFEMGYASAIATVLFLAMILCRKLFEAILNRVGK